MKKANRKSAPLGALQPAAPASSSVLYSTFLALLFTVGLALLRSSCAPGNVFWTSQQQNATTQITCERPESTISLVDVYGKESTILPTVSLTLDALREVCPSHMHLHSSTTSILFLQGMLHLYGFNYDEARANFEAALREQGDEECTLCHFGLAYSYHPHLNSPLDEAGAVDGRRVVESRIEQLARPQRLQSPPCRFEAYLLQAQLVLLNPATWNTTATSDYRRALQHLVESDTAPPRLVRILLAESIMNESPWLYYDERSGGLLPSAATALDLLKLVVLAGGGGGGGGGVFPHPLALHLMIHLCEQNNGLVASLGLKAADLLASAMNGSFSGHLVHMPAHIYTRVGDFGKSIATSQAAIAVDKFYVAKCVKPYAPLHNVALLVMAALYKGDETMALRFAPSLSDSDSYSLDGDRALYLTALFPMPRELVLARFGRWNLMADEEKEEEEEGGDRSFAAGVGGGSWWFGDELRLRRRRPRRRHLIQSPPPPSSQRPAFVNAMRVYAQALRRIHQLPSPDSAKLDAASAAMSQATQRISPDDKAPSHVFYPNHVELGLLMNATVQAAVAFKRGRFGQAVVLLQAAVKLQDSFHYMEPENWYLPMRHCEAAVHLAWAATFPDCSFKNASLNAAIAALEADLSSHHPRTVWALRGLGQARHAQRACGVEAEVEAETELELEVVYRSPCCEVTGCSLR